MRFRLYINTLKYLKLSQIFWRLRYTFLPIPNPVRKGALIREWKYKWNSPSWNHEVWDGYQKFTFFCESHSISKSEHWNDKSKDALWLYNLHYLDCLNNQSNLNVEQELSLINTWVHDNTEPSEIGWDPYCISLRLVNIIKWMSENNISETNIVESIELQADNLLHKLEFHIQANHLFTNIKSLIFVGCFLEGETAQKCLDKGVSLLESELKEQFGADGGHYEISPMYHQILMWDLLDLTLLAQISMESRLLMYSESIQECIIRAEKWRVTMLHTNQEIAFFNDSALDIAPPNEVIEEYLKLLDIRVNQIDEKHCYLKDSGFHVIKLKNNGKLIFDCCRLGPDYQPGHAHADTLSFEMSLFNKKLFVNSGTSLYGTSELREFQRSTCAHNTVTVNNRNSSQVWGGFRVAKRASVIESRIEKSAKSIKITGAHNGFKKQSISGVHSRSITVSERSLKVNDKIEELGSGSAVARFYLHPEVKVEKVTQQSVKLVLENQKITFNACGYINVKDSKWYPRFGAELQNLCLEVEFKTDELKSEIMW